MTFAYSVKTPKGIPMRMGVGAVSWGTFTNDTSDCGGDIYTGLSYIEAFVPGITGSSAPADGVAVNETFPKSSDGITIVTKKGVDGVFIAFGRLNG